jgi:hypothetical protein
VEFSGQIIPPNTMGYFRVTSNSGSHPIQLIDSGDFLIGSGGQCQLRLGAPEIPDVHSILKTDGSSAVLEALSHSPQILLNGTPVTTTTRLSDGDLLEISQYRLLYRVAAADQRITLNESDFAHIGEPAQGTENAAAPNAEELVDQLAQELELVESHQHTTQQGIAELLAAAQQIEHTPASADSEQPAADITSVEALAHVADILKRQHEASRIRLESMTDVLGNVVQQQKMIADALQLLSEKIVAMESANDPFHRRASA